MTGATETAPLGSPRANARFGGSRRTIAGLATGVVAVAAVATVVAVEHSHSASPAVASAPPLSPIERRAIVADRPLINGIPTALSQVAHGISDISRGRLTPEKVRAQLAGLPALAALDHAISQPDAATDAITTAETQAVAGRRPSFSTLPQSVNNLEQIQGQIVPAARALLHGAGVNLSAAAATSALENDRGLTDLSQLIGSWPQTYGALVLLEQAADS